MMYNNNDDDEFRVGIRGGGAGGWGGESRLMGRKDY